MTKRCYVLMVWPLLDLVDDLLVFLCCAMSGIVLLCPIPDTKLAQTGLLPRCPTSSSKEAACRSLASTLKMPPESTSVHVLGGPNTRD